MRKLILGVTACLMAAPVGCSSSTTTGGSDAAGGGGSNADKIVGKWEAADKSDEMPAGAVMEFTKDKNVVMHMDAGGKQMSMPIGTYKVEGDKLTLTMKKGEKEDSETDTIKSLTDDPLTLSDPKGKEIKFKRKK